MKTKYFTLSAFVISLLILTLLDANNVRPDAAYAQTLIAAPAVVQTANLAPLPLSFVPNEGQTDPLVQFETRGLGGTLFFTPGEVMLALPNRAGEETAELLSLPQTINRQSSVETSPSLLPPTIVRLQFEGTNPAPAITGVESQAGQVNYFAGNEPGQWQTSLPTYAGIVYQQLYPGIDLRYDGVDGTLKGTYHVAPGADPGHIHWRYEGATGVQVDETSGDLVVTLSTQRHLSEHTPLAWQEIEGRRVFVNVAYTLTPKGQVGFALGTYNPAYPLVIDPTLLYSSYLGGSGSDLSYDLAVDNAGNIYLVGETTSTNFPTSPGAFDTSANSNNDVFIAKLSADGRTLLYSTYLGGSDYDGGTAIEVDQSGQVYITGSTWSPNFPTTPGALDQSLGGGRDGFVTKLNAAGNALLYSTYLGGDNWDYGFCLDVDTAGQVYVGGFTHDGFPTTANGVQPTFGGLGDGFVAKLNATGTALVYSTYLGGNSYESVPGIVVDEAGYAYVAGETHSTNFPTTAGAWDRTCSNCSTNTSTDGFAAKLTPTGNALSYSTFIGGSSTPTSEGFSAIKVDAAGNAYVIGYTTAADFPTTPGALQPAFGGGGRDVMVTKLNPTGSSLLYSTYLGGSGADEGHDLALDNLGQVYLTGRTDSPNFPTLDPLQSVNQGGRDAFVVKLNAAGSALLYSTYLGGSGDENTDSSNAVNPRLGGITFTNVGSVYVTGVTASANFPLADPLHAGFGGLSDVFVLKLSDNHIWHVATNGSDVTGDGSETKPFATIQHGIDRAGSGDTVLVHPGTYQENIKFNGKNITVGSFFVMTGNKSYIAQTVIDGNRSGRVVTFENGENAGAVLSGLTLTNGYIQGTGTAGSGGGLACFNANPTLTHLIVSGNQATAEGGGLYFSYCSSKLQDTLVTNNTAFAGGGIRYSYGSPSLENVAITHNSTQRDGAGIQFYHADASVKNALIANNVGGAKGGGLMFDRSSPTVINVTIADNTTTGHGGGLNVSYASNPTLINSIVWGNAPEQIYFDPAWPGEVVTIQYSDVQGGAAGIVTNGQGPVNWGAGNLDTDPRFVGGSDYHLAPNSPPIGAGTLADAPAADLDGSLRPNPAGSYPDLGAYEHPLGSPQPLSTLQGHVYLDWRSSGHYTATRVVLIGPRQTYTATTDPNGNFTLTDLYADTYTLQATHSLFVQARRTVTVSTTSTQALPEIGLWAGDIDQNQKVNLYDWYLLAAAIFPVSNPLFDINDDGLTNLQDLAILTLNLGRPNMTTTNPPIRPGLASLDLGQPLMTARSEGQLKLAPSGDHEMTLHLEEVSQPIYAIGTRLTLPSGATVTEVEAGPAFAGGFLEWHQDGSTLYLVVAPPEERAISQNTEVAVIRGATFVAEVAAANSIATGPTKELFLPLIIK